MLYDLGLVDEGDHPHFVLAQERVGFPDFLDERAPFLGRNPAGFEVGDVDDLACGVSAPAFGLSPLYPLAPHLVAVPPVVADELEAFVRDVLGDAGDKVAWAQHLEIVPDLRVHPRAVNV